MLTLGRATLGTAKKEDDVLSHYESAAHFSAAPASGMTAGLTEATSADILARILTSLEDDKAEDVLAIDLAGKSEMADHMVVASGRSSRQVASISDKLVERLKQDLNVLCKVEGKDAGDWVLIDAGDVIVHVFRPEVREFYQIEKMWMSQSQAGAAAKN